MDAMTYDKRIPKDIQDTLRALNISPDDATHTVGQGRSMFGVFDFDVWAPRGKTFNASGCHCFVVNAIAGDGTTRAGCWERVRDELAAGLSDCDCEDCRPDVHEGVGEL